MLNLVFLRLLTPSFFQPSRSSFRPAFIPIHHFFRPYSFLLFLLWLITPSPPFRHAFLTPPLPCIIKRCLPCPPAFLQSVAHIFRPTLMNYADRCEHKSMINYITKACELRCIEVPRRDSRTEILLFNPSLCTKSMQLNRIHATTHNSPQPRVM